MEEWTTIDEFPNYEISNQGRIRNRNTKQILRQKVDRGYHRIMLYRDGETCTKQIHRLVADSFVPNIDNKKEVNHIDGNKDNNRADNLEWCTRGENMKHAFANGLKTPSGGVPKKKVRVLETGDIYDSAYECARQIDCDQGHINQCLTGRRKSHKGYHFEYA